MKRRAYPSDLNDAQWRLMEPLLPAAQPGGRPRSVDLREVVNACLYVAREGIHWRALPHDFPPWPTVYHYFRRWRNEGVWQRVHDALRDQLRQAAGREVSPSALILDSQSVKTSEKGAARLRRRQESERPQAPPARGYAGVDPGGRRPRGRLSRS